MVNTAKKPTATPAPAPKSLPLGGINLSKLEKAAAVLTQEDKFRADLSYATAQFINGKPPFGGLYVDIEDLPKCGWYGLPLPDGAREENKIPFGIEKQKKPGLLFETVRLIVVDQSPRLLEVTGDGEAAYKWAMSQYQAGKDYDPYHIQLGNRNALVGIYCDADGNYSDPKSGIPYSGKDLYEAVAPAPGSDEKALVGLRTFYLIHLVNEQGELLHAKPMCLSLKGLAAAHFGSALKETGKSLLNQLGEAIGDNKLASAVLTRNSLRDFIFVMQLEGRGEGKNSNWITCIACNEEGTPLVGGDYIDDDALKSKLTDTFEANDGFAWKFAQQMSAQCGYHKLEGSLANLALPEGTVNVSVMEDNSEKFDF